MQRTPVPGCGPLFAPLEDALTQQFLPALLQVEKVEQRVVKKLCDDGKYRPALRFVAQRHKGGVLQPGPRR